MNSPPLLDKLSAALAPEYQVTRELGTGGMGSVFLAREPTLRRDVAVKVLAPDLARDEVSRARFEREAQAVASLSHPNVVGVYRVGELADGTPFFVMQYVAGESLAARIAREGPMEVAEARRALAQVASALAAAHAKGIIHRDIKPANVLHDLESNRVLVSDFGIAALRASSEVEAPLHLTGTGMSIGTPQYMSPEQLLAEKVSDKTDVYGLGLLGYELLAGRGPFEVTSARELIAAVLRDTPKPLSSLRSDMDPELEGLLAACLNRDPDERPTAAEVVQRLAVDQPPIIEWPPPGLETIHGEGGRLARRIATGSVPLAVGMSFLLDAWVPIGRLAVVPLAISLLIVIGVVALGWASWHVARLAHAAARGVGHGYGWGTVAEVMADRRGDTGSLISGSREYATLSATERERLRRLRMTATLLLMTAAVLPSVITLGLAFGLARVVSPPLFPMLAILTPTAFLIAGLLLIAREDRRLDDGRRRLKRQRPSVEWSAIVPIWVTSFERARSGQRLGGGSTARSRLVRALALGAAVTLGVAAFAVLPALLVGAAGPLTWNALATEAASGFGGSLRTVSALAEAVRSLRPAPDSTLSPDEAGRLFHQLIGDRRSRLPLRPVPGPAPSDWLPHESAPFYYWHLVRDSVMRRATRGFTPGEARYLQTIADNPRFAIVRRLGRAREMDLVGGRFVLPFPDSASVADLDFTSSFDLREVAAASVARAALLVSQARRAEAESLLLETASLGLLVTDEAFGSYEALAGNLVTSIASRALLSLYETAGPPSSAARLRQLSDSIIAATAAPNAQSDFERYLGPYTDRVHDVRFGVLNIVSGTASGAPRSLRMQYLRLIPYMRCSNLRELLFGLSPITKSYIAEARRVMVRRPSDAALFDLLLRPPRLRLPGEHETDIVGRIVALSSRLTGNPWVDYCYRLGMRLAISERGRSLEP